MTNFGEKIQTLPHALSSWLSAFHVSLLIVHITGFSMDNPEFFQRSIEIAGEILLIGIHMIEGKKTMKGM